MRKLLPLAVLCATLTAISGLVLADAPLIMVCLGAPAVFTLLGSPRGRGVLGHRWLVSAPLVGAAVLLRWWGGGPAHELLVAALRVASAVAWSSLLSTILTAREIRAGLKTLGAPVAFVELIADTRRFAVQLATTASEAWTAATLRAGLSSVRAAAGTSGQVAGVVVVRAFDRAESVAIASALRGGHLLEVATAEAARSSWRGSSA